MAKWLRYYCRTVIEDGFDETGAPLLREQLTQMAVTDNAACRAVAEQEAYGPIESWDDGLPEPETVPTAQDDTDAMLIDHEYRLTLLELGVIE